MKIPLSWLKDHVDLTLAPSQIAKVLTMAGLEVDGVDNKAPEFTKVVVARVLETAPHPNADKLCIAKVTDGAEVFQVVCGAPNCRPHLKTALALLGAELKEADGAVFKVKKSKIRGVESFGMLCSGKELGLSEESNGIMEFSDNLREGTDVASLYSDVIFEISLTPNLSHAASLVGVARELSAHLGSKFHFPEKPFLNEKLPSIQEKIELAVHAVESCPRYSARIVEGIKVGPSPEWLKSRLEASGLRSVNNVVDATNYVLLLLGQPLHAFDLDKIKGKISVRMAKEGEKIKTLDDKERMLDPETLLISDENGPAAIAGVMGGREQEVTDKTERILLESAYFLPSSVRRTSKKLGVSTEASKRFERGCDPNHTLLALDLAVKILEDIAGGEVRAGFIDIKTGDFKELEIACRLERIHAILGTKISLSEVESIFKRLDFHVRLDAHGLMHVKVPTFRVDVTSEIDLIEEVAKVYGYDNIVRQSPYYEGSQLPHSPLFTFEREARRKLIAEGLQEFVTCDLVGNTAFFRAFGSEKPPEGTIEVLNPVSVEQSALRTSLFPGLLEIIKHNYDRESHDIAGFEVGRLHFKKESKYLEETSIGIVLSGHHSLNPYDPKPREFDFRDLKGIVDNFLRGLGIEGYSFRPSSSETLHPGRQASVFVQGQKMGTLGEVHPSVVRRLDVPQRIFFSEISLSELFPMRIKEIKMCPLPIYPSSKRVWTVTLLEKASTGQVIDAIKSIPSQILERVSLIDIFRSEQLGKNKKNVTFSFIYRDNDKTIEQEKVDLEHNRIIAAALNLIEGCLPEGRD